MSSPTSKPPGETGKGTGEGKPFLREVIRRFVCDDGLASAEASLGLPESELITHDHAMALVWFSDVEGFSSFSQHREACEVASTIRRIMDLQVDEIDKAGGQIDKFMGDGLMAFWRLSDEIHMGQTAEKAVRAALSSIAAIRDLVRNEGLPLDIRIGLHLGPVVIGDFGSRGRISYTLIGETVNAAARYQQAYVDLDGRKLSRLRLSDAVFTQLTDADLLKRIGSEPSRFVTKNANEFDAYISLDSEN